MIIWTYCTSYNLLPSDFNNVKTSRFGLNLHVQRVYRQEVGESGSRLREQRGLQWLRTERPQLTDPTGKRCSKENGLRSFDWQSFLLQLLSDSKNGFQPLRLQWFGFKSHEWFNSDPNVRIVFDLTTRRCFNCFEPNTCELPKWHKFEPMPLEMEGCWAAYEPFFCRLVLPGSRTQRIHLTYIYILYIYIFT